MATPETLEREEAALPEKMPGYRVYQARTAIRDLIDEYGDLKAELILSALLADEQVKANQ